MDINKLLTQKNMTRYRLAKQSGIPQTTMTDICSGKAKLENCSGETLYKISKTLGVSMESLIEDAMEYRADFETYKKNIRRRVKGMGDLAFIIDALESGEIRRLYDKEWYPECLYLLAMVDYISRENDLPACADYADIRKAKLRQRVYPLDVLEMCGVVNSDAPKEKSLKDSIPEFIRHNIVESEARNAV